MTSDVSDETRRTQRVTLTFDIEQRWLDASADFKGSNQGITVGEVAAWLCKRHDARDGYIHFTVDQFGRTTS